MTRYISKTFLQGLAALLPILVTLYLIYWLAMLFERLLAPVIGTLLPVYFPGLGLLVSLVLVFLFGLLLQAYVFRALFDLGERLVQRLPGIKIIYGAVQDLLDFVRQAQGRQGEQVVLVSLPLGDTEARLIGFVTRRDFDALPAALGDDERIAVYLPMSYQIGGYTLFLPRDRVQPLDLPIDQAMRLAITAGMSSAKGK